MSATRPHDATADPATGGQEFDFDVLDVGSGDGTARGCHTPGVHEEQR